MSAWDEQKHVDFLLSMQDGLKSEMTKESQDRVVAAMRARGHNTVTWDGLRYAPPF